MESWASLSSGVNGVPLCTAVGSAFIPAPLPWPCQEGILLSGICRQGNLNMSQSKCLNSVSELGGQFSSQLWTVTCMRTHTYRERYTQRETDRAIHTKRVSQTDRQRYTERNMAGFCVRVWNTRIQHPAVDSSLSLDPSLFLPLSFSPLSPSLHVYMCVCLTPTSLCWPSQLCHNPMVPWSCILHFFLTKVNLNKRRSTMGASFQGCNTSNLSTEKNKTKTLIFQWSAWISNEWINEVINRSSGKKRSMLQRETSPGDTLHLPNDTVSAARETAQSPSPGLYVKSLCSCHNSSTSVPYHPIRLKTFEY